MGTIKSQPVYADLQFEPRARFHVIVTAGEGAVGAGPVLDALSRSISRGEVFHVDSPQDDERHGSVYDARPGIMVDRFTSEDALFSALGVFLPTIPVSAQIYVSGSELFIWKVAEACREGGVIRENIQMELRGSRARRVYCVHCKTMTEKVVASICTCVGCGLSLFVRDHFSRYLQAYAGVRVDAEEPGVVPRSEEIYL